MISSLRRAGAQAGLASGCASTSRTQVRLHALPRRQVDVDRQVRRTRGTPRSQARICRQASRSTQRPIGTIRPVSSAVGMNSAGEHHAARRMLPAEQRLEAAQLPVRRARRSAGSRPRSSLPLERVPQIGLELQPLARPPPASTCRRPRSAPCRAPWRGTSPCRRRAPCPRRAGSAASLMHDADADRREDLAAVQRRTAAPTAASRRSATACASAALRTPSSRTVNSSPPSRASVCSPPKRGTVSVDRSDCSSRRAMPISSSSPARWPRLSLTILKRSTSRKNTANDGAAPASARRAISRSSRSMNSTRLGRPVSGSARRAVTCVRMRASATGSRSAW